MNRRDFLLAAAAAPLAAAPRKQPELCIFSKHMADFNYEELGKHAKQIGFDGVDLTVRAKGHVWPERAAEDMPRAVEAIRSHGLTVPMITTNLLSAAEPAARPTLSTAARLRVPYWKIGYYRYKLLQVERSLAEAKHSTAGLAALSKEYGLEAGFHNHSGDYIGSAVWDTRDIIASLDAKAIGYYFDPAHATIEGGLAGWQISQSLAVTRLKMVALKDFYWDKTGQGWKLKWCPLGQGMVNWDRVFAGFAQARFAGPMSLHIEYDPKDELAAIANDLAFLKKAVAKAYAA